MNVCVDIENILSSSFSRDNLRRQYWKYIRCDSPGKCYNWFQSCEEDNGDWSVALIMNEMMNFYARFLVFTSPWSLTILNRTSWKPLFDRKKHRYQNRHESFWRSQQQILQGTHQIRWREVGSNFSAFLKITTSIQNLE